MRLYWSLTGKLRWEPRGRDRLVVQGSPAVRTIDITYANHALTLRTARADFIVRRGQKLNPVCTAFPHCGQALRVVNAIGSKE